MEDGKQPCVFLLPFRRQRPLGTHCFVELRAEEAGLHAAVDDVPRQHGIGRPIAEHEEVGVDPRFGDGGAPVAAVSFGGFDRRRNAPVTERKAKRLRQMLSGIDNVYFNIKSERHSYYQALLSLGDRRVAPAIEAAERNGGNWRAAVAESGVDADFYIFRDRSDDQVLPWDIIDGGMKTSFFRSEFDKGLREEWTLPPKRNKDNLKLLPVLQ